MSTDARSPSASEVPSEPADAAAPARLPLEHGLAVPTDDLPRLFEEFSRVTAELSASHDLLLAQVADLRSELAAKDRRLEHKKRLEALGGVAAGVAHEIRNPLGGIRLTVDALIGDRPEGRTRRRLEHVRSAVLHLDRIVEDLLTFTRVHRLQRRQHRAGELVRAALELAFPDPAERAGLPADGPPDLLVSVDRTVFTQVLLNLLVNARQATAAVEAPLGVWWGERDECIWFEIADDGPGIPAGEEERIFHPFHSLRDGGTGLGLAIVHSRVEAHGGEIALVDEAWGGGESWRGARFRVLLPRRSESPPHPEQEVK